MIRSFIVLMLVVFSARHAAATENLIAFVGEKISVEEQKVHLGPREILLDAAFKATYRVLDVVYGEYAGETIAFDVYDHYGRPAFESHRNVLLFVSKYEDSDGYVHQKYQYFPVFRTVSGSWAGCGSPYANEPDVHHRDLKARKLDFGSDAWFDIAGLSRREIRRTYPRRYYEIKQGRAYCKKGNPVAELFEVKRQGVLKARGYFQNP